MPLRVPEYLLSGFLVSKNMFTKVAVILDSKRETNLTGVIFIYFAKEWFCVRVSILDLEIFIDS